MSEQRKELKQQKDRLNHLIIIYKCAIQDRERILTLNKSSVKEQKHVEECWLVLQEHIDEIFSSKISTL